MSLHRWSLPSRAFAREKSKNSDPAQDTKFSTIGSTTSSSYACPEHPNIPRALADYLKNENRFVKPGDVRSVPSSSQPLATRVENIPTPPKLTDTKSDTVLNRSSTPVYYTAKRHLIDLISLVKNEAAKGNDSHDLSSERDAMTKSPPSMIRVRSSSSSYPSEGIRSPSDHCRSPQLNPWSESFMTELSHYGTYPSREASSRSSVSTNDVSASGRRSRQCLIEELAAADGISDTDTRTISRDFNSKQPLSDIASVGSLQEQEDNHSSNSERNGDLANENLQRLALSRGDLMSMLDGQGSSTSAIHGSLPEIQSFTHFSSSEDDLPYRLSNTGSADRLRQSTEANATRPSKIHWKGQGNVFNTMPAVLSRKRARASISTTASPSENQQAPGPHVKDPDSFSTNFSQRIHKFKIRKWIKKVCLRTKVRFDSAVRPEASSPKVVEKKSSKSKSKSHKQRRSKKHSGAHKPKSRYIKAYWKPMKKSEGKTHRFIRSLTKKNSIQLPIEDKSTVDHRRIQSCPP
ncbi:hypothetical protein M426DRAFT_19288 [Hypoxylon sp. CI-4A]|nr:hypothetical protein M426DRAFT_19288 [Hypoxylon sp. CI-4A]